MVGRAKYDGMGRGSFMNVIYMDIVNISFWSRRRVLQIQPDEVQGRKGWMCIGGGGCCCPRGLGGSCKDQLCGQKCYYYVPGWDLNIPKNTYIYLLFIIINII